MVDLDNDGWPGSFLRHRQSLSRNREEICPPWPIVRRASSSAIWATANSRNCSTAPARAFQPPHSSRGCAFGDFDNDGDIDVLIMNMNEPPSLLRNDLQKPDETAALDQGQTDRHEVEPQRHRLARDRQLRRQEAGAGSDRRNRVTYSVNDSRLHFGTRRGGDCRHRGPLDQRSFRRIPESETRPSAGYTGRAMESSIASISPSRRNNVAVR